MEEGIMEIRMTIETIQKWADESGMVECPQCGCTDVEVTSVEQGTMGNEYDIFATCGNCEWEFAAMF